MLRYLNPYIIDRKDCKIKLNNSFTYDYFISH